MSKSKKKKKDKKIKYVIAICIVILIIELGVFVSSILFKRAESIYFDGINAIRKNDHYYIAVGSNNDNDLHYEKAKISIYDEKRTKLFEKLYNVGFNSAFFGVCLDDNGFVAVGSYEKTEEEHDDSIRRALIVKYDYDGNIVFEQDFQLLDNSKFTKVVVANDGYYVVGQSIFKSTKVGNDSGGAIIVKYNKEGNMEWHKSVGNAKNGIFNDLYLAESGIYVVGLLDDSVGLIAKYQFNGDIVFQKEIEGISGIGFRGIIQADSSLYISGSIKTEDQDGAILYKVNEDGDILNSQLYNKASNANFHNLVYDGDSSVVVIGSSFTEKKSAEPTADSVNYDGLVVKYNLDLEMVTDAMYGDDRDDYFTDIIYDKSDYLVVGYSSYEDGSYLSKFIHYSDALKVLGVES